MTDPKNPEAQNEELNLDELKGAPGGFSHHANIDRLKKSANLQKDDGKLRIGIGEKKLVEDLSLTYKLKDVIITS